MDRAFAKFAGWVVARQAGLLLLTAALVVLMAWWIYARSREMAIEQASRQQTMLAEQTARGIESYYQSIIETLDLLRRNSTDELAATSLGDSAAGIVTSEVRRQEPPGPRRRGSPADRLDAVREPIRNGPAALLPRQVLLPVFWEQLRDRTSQLFMLDQSSGRVLLRFGDSGATDLDELVESRRAWLAAVSEAAVSKTGETQGELANLVCVPVPSGKRLICAVVPVARIESRFLSNITKDGSSGAMLLDESGRVMSCNHREMVGMSLLTELANPFLLETLTRTLNSGEPTTTVVPRNRTVSGNEVEPGLVSVQPLQIAGGRWWLTVSSPMTEVEQVIQIMFRRISAFAGLAIGVFTFAFSRIAVSQIKARAREEKVRNELLRKEVEQARRIQLAWLPGNAAEAPGIDICAINKPASQISGDFYNWFVLPDGRTCVLIGDVSGHGMAAAFLMATTQVLLRATMLRVQDPGRAVTIVNSELTRQDFNGQFVTLQVLAIDPTRGTVDVANAGHPPPVFIRDGKVGLLPVEPQLVAGVEKELSYPTESFEFKGDASLLLYTDGIPDAPRPDNRRFGDDGLVTSLEAHCGSAAEIVERVVNAIDRFRTGRELSDDVTMVAVRCPDRNAATSSSSES